MRTIEAAHALDTGARTIQRIRIAPLIWVRGEFVHTRCEPPHLFEDTQLRGPFRTWRHQHIFSADDEGARLTDAIEFTTLAPDFVILPRLRRLFAYRHEVTRAWCEDRGEGHDTGTKKTS